MTYELSGSQHVLHNKLKNGDFHKLPFTYISEYDDETTPNIIKWRKRREYSSVTLSTTWNTEVLPGWRVKASDEGSVSVAVAPVMNDGTRLWSRDGGKVVAFTFSGTATATMEQDIDYFNEFYMNYGTAAASFYHISGNVFCNIGVVTDSTVNNIFNLYSGSAGAYFRTGGVLLCPGTIESSMIYQVTLNGISGESVGVGGFSWVLGKQIPYCPYSHSFVEEAIPTDGLIMFEDEVALGYEAIGEDLYLYQTYGDPLCVDNLPPTGVPRESWAVSDQVGTSQHNAHATRNPYINSEIGWFTDEALHGTRVPSIDFADMGNSTRNANIVNATSLTAGVWQYVFGTWGHFGITTQPAYTSGSLAQLQVMEFAKHSRVAIGLPANPGQSFTLTAGGSGKMDGWDQIHIHFIIPQELSVDPPYRTFKIGRKI